MAFDTDDELASCLRTWRQRVGPAEVGLIDDGRRRVSGLRREEVAQLAGVSMDYLTRLEQGRARRPSASVLAALARALRLNETERDHLYRLGGQAPPGIGIIDSHIPPSLARLIDRLADVAVVVTTVASEVVAVNALAGALLGESVTGTRRERTLAWRHFTGLPSVRVYRTEVERRDDQEVLVADLQRAQAAYPGDGYLADLIDDLHNQVPEFAELWRRHNLNNRHMRQKLISHPEVGELTVDCDDLTVSGTALQVAVFSAEPGSPSARALELLAAIGLQRFDVAEA